MTADHINPSHYRDHPSGVECIDIIRHMPFCAGAAIKYIWRAGKKGDAVQDLCKAIRNIEFEIERLGGELPTERTEAPAGSLSMSVIEGYLFQTDRQLAPADAVVIRRSDLFELADQLAGRSNVVPIFEAFHVETAV